MLGLLFSLGAHYHTDTSTGKESSILRWLSTHCGLALGAKLCNHGLHEINGAGICALASRKCCQEMAMAYKNN